MMNLSISLQQGLKLSQSNQLRLNQNHRLNLRLRFFGTLHRGEYLFKATCPECNCEMPAVEIIKGFRADPHDFTTCCFHCQKRFQPRLVWSNADTRKEVFFYCNIQTKEKMYGLEMLSPEDFEKKHSSTYHSAIAHHGTLKNAFAEIGILYSFDEIADAKSKIEPFLGKLFDTTIAKISGIDVKVVRRMRITAKIPRCYTECDDGDE